MLVARGVTRLRRSVHEGATISTCRFPPDRDCSSSSTGVTTAALGSASLPTVSTPASENVNDASWLRANSTFDKELEFVLLYPCHQIARW